MGESEKTAPGGWAGLERHRVELRLSLRIMASGLLAYVVAELLGLAQGYWAVLTAVIVMQASLGGSLKAMLDRLVGTIAGAVCGIAVAVLMPRAGPVTTGLALLVGLLPASLLVAFRPAYRIAPVTVVIVVLVYAGAGTALASGLARTFEIGLGTVIAFLVALLVLPSRAHQLLPAAVRDGLAAIGEQIRLLLGDLTQVPERSQVQALHDRIRAGAERAAAIAQEAARERASRVSDTEDPDPLVRTLRRLGHDVIMLARLRATALPEPLAARLAPAAAAAAQAAAGFMADCGAALAGGGGMPSVAAIADAIAAYRAATTALRQEGLIRQLPGDAAEQIFGLAFALEQLGRNLGDLAARAAEFMQSERPGSG